VRSTTWGSCLSRAAAWRRAMRRRRGSIARQLTKGTCRRSTNLVTCLPFIAAYSTMQSAGHGCAGTAQAKSNLGTHNVLCVRLD
jgi:hypothetical protein